MGTGFAKKKKQAKMMQEQFQRMQDEIKNVEVIGVSGGELVKVTLDGEGNLKNIDIKPECIDPEDSEGLEDLIKVAFQEAKNQLDKKQKDMPGLSSLGLF